MVARTSGVLQQFTHKVHDNSWSERQILSPQRLGGFFPIIRLKCYIISSSRVCQSVDTLPHLVGFWGLYILKDAQPLKPIVVSSIAMSWPGIMYSTDFDFTCFTIVSVLLVFPAATEVACSIQWICRNLSRENTSQKKGTWSIHPLVYGNFGHSHI